MTGTKAGGIKARETNMLRHGKDFYQRIGAKGGHNGHTGGFAANPALARIAGAKGGRISKRGPSKKEPKQISRERGVWLRRRLFKIIDMERKGHLVRFYLGKQSLKDWGGDDWNDRPYEHNAELVNPKYVKAYLDIVFPFEFSVLEPCDGHNNSKWSKDDMKARKTPILVVSARPDLYSFEDGLADSESELYYMGDFFSSRDNAIQYIEKEVK